MEHLSHLLDMLRVAKFEDGALCLLAWGGCRLCKWLKITPWTLNVTNRDGKMQIDFHAEQCSAPLPTSSAKRLPITEPQPARKRSRALPSDTSADNS